jgi:hypothetical protein
MTAQRHLMRQAVLAELDQVRPGALERQKVVGARIGEARRDDLVTHGDVPRQKGLGERLQLVGERPHVVVADEASRMFEPGRLVREESQGPILRELWTLYYVR